MLREPWPHQQRALELLRQSLASGHRRPMLQSPTGSGKTGLAAMIVAGSLRKSKRVVFCVPFISLINQTLAAFEAEGITDVGVIQARHERTDWSQPIQIASTETLARRQDIPAADLVMIDEAHRWYKFYGRWMVKPGWESVPFIGLSATPWAPVLGKFYDDLCLVTTTAELIRDGFLAPFRVFAPSHPDLTGVSTLAGDYHEGQLADAMNRPPLIADAVKNWIRHGEGRPTLVFAVDLPHAKALQMQFEEAGVRAGYVDADTPLDERDAIGRRLKSGDLKVVCNVGTMTTGVDLDVRCIVLCRPTKSEMLFTQIIGRGLRTAPGKTDCLVFDHSDTHARLGFVTDIHHDKLSRGVERQLQAKRERPKLKECSQCHFVEPATKPGCSACLFMPERQNKVEVMDGELREIGAPQQFHFATPLAEKQRWLSALVTAGRKRGCKAGWADNIFREKFNEWPGPGLDRQKLGPVDRDVENFIKFRTIAYYRSAKRSAS